MLCPPLFLRFLSFFSAPTSFLSPDFFFYLTLVFIGVLSCTPLLCSTGVLPSLWLFVSSCSPGFLRALPSQVSQASGPPCLCERISNQLCPKNCIRFPCLFIRVFTLVSPVVFSVLTFSAYLFSVLALSTFSGFFIFFSADLLVFVSFPFNLGFFPLLSSSFCFCSVRGSHRSPHPRAFLPGLFSDGASPFGWWSALGCVQRTPGRGGGARRSEARTGGGRAPMAVPARSPPPTSAALG